MPVLARCSCTGALAFVLVLVLGTTSSTVLPSKAVQRWVMYSPPAAVPVGLIISPGFVAEDDLAAKGLELVHISGHEDPCLRLMLP